MTDIPQKTRFQKLLKPALVAGLLGFVAGCWYLVVDSDDGLSRDDAAAASLPALDPGSAWTAALGRSHELALKPTFALARIPSPRRASAAAKAKAAAIATAYASTSPAASAAAAGPTATAAPPATVEPPPAATDAGHAALAVTVDHARAVAWPMTLSASGVVAAWMEASIGARVSGLPLVEVRVSVGDHVRKGQVLARFDDASVRIEVAQTTAAAAQAAAAFRQAEANNARVQKISGTGALSDQDLLQYETAVETTRAQLAQAQAQLDAAHLKLSLTEVRAPDDGIISVRNASLGAVPPPGNTELFRLIRRGRLEWRPELDAVKLAAVRAGTHALLKLPDGSNTTGVVRQLAPALDGGTRLGYAFVDLPARSAALPGMYLSGDLELGSRTALVVPVESVVVRDGRSYVLRVAANQARLAAVTTGRVLGDHIEITGGLTAGTEVVRRGAGFLSDGDRVRVIAQAGATGSADAIGVQASSARAGVARP